MITGNPSLKWVYKKEKLAWSHHMIIVAATDVATILEVEILTTRQNSKWCCWTLFKEDEMNVPWTITKDYRCNWIWTLTITLILHTIKSKLEHFTQWISLEKTENLILCWPFSYSSNILRGIYLFYGRCWST